MGHFKVRITQYLRVSPFPTLDTDFDDVGTDYYFDRIKGQISSSGSFLSGIDVEPSFQNGLDNHPINFENRERTKRKPSIEDATRQQLRWEAERARVREEENRRIDLEWRAIEACKNKDALIAFAECLISGSTFREIAEHVGFPSCENILIREVSKFVMQVIVPADVDIAACKELLEMSFEEMLLLAERLNWGR